MSEERKISEHVLQLSGKATLMEELKMGRAFKLEIDGAVDRTMDDDNEDGTITRYYRFKPILVKVLYEGGEITKTKDIRKRSQQMRAIIHHEWENRDDAIPEEEYYDRRMAELNKKLFDGQI